MSFILQPQTAGSGTVTSVDMTVPTFLNVAGNPITTSGTLAVTLSGLALPVSSGGTGVVTAPGAGQLLIGTGTAFNLSTLTAGSGVTITNGSGTITIAAAGGGGGATGSDIFLANNFGGFSCL